MNQGEDRRVARRFPVKAGAIVNIRKKHILTLGRNVFVKVGPVADISAAGMSVTYFSDKDLFESSLKLTIMTPSGKTIIDNLLYETVYDVEIGMLPDGRKIRKRAVRFVKVSGPQSAWLACMIHNLSSRQAELNHPTPESERPEVLREVL